MLRPVLCLQQLSLDDDDHAQLQAPSHAVFMANGNLVVSETSQLRIFRETGKLLRAVDISFDGPFGIAVGENALCVADCRKNRLVALELDPQSEITRQKFSIKLQSPIAVVLHRDRAFVTEQVNHTVAICNLKTGTLERRFGGEGSGGGELWCPYGIAAYDSTLYVADSWNHRIARFSLRGEWLGAWGEAGGAPGRFRSPYGVGVAAGVLVVSEAGNKRLQLLALADGSPLWHGSPHSMHGPCGSLRMLSAEGR
ncbi:hypothetical protein AB1Y20_007586 [Prymnesium parvum]|uniref:Peptidylamidoglycolate lyase n=1 Tax=Prymnesium parvum TaxID=97485 RepID=A0AB34IXD9_PRYPA